MRSTDRILVLEKIDPKANADGFLDPSVFEGKNNLHAVMDTNTTMWSFKYEHGHVPPALKGRWTSFPFAHKHAEQYLLAKKIKIVEVKD